MKKAPSLFLLFLLLLVNGISVAQNNILAGKVTDENNHPVSGAIVKVRNAHNDIIAKTDDKGLYYTGKIPQGDYRVVIVANGRKHIANRVHITWEKHFCNFSLQRKKAIALMTTSDPFVAARFAEIEKEDFHTIIEYN